MPATGAPPPASPPPPSTDALRAADSPSASPPPPATDDAPRAAARPLVFVTIGTDWHAFDRLVNWIDGWLTDRATRSEPGVDCLFQYGATAAPRIARGRDYLPPDELAEAFAAATVVVCHGGPATITQARAAGHRPIVVARDPALGEHVDAHQTRFTARLAADGLVASALTEVKLRDALDTAIVAPDTYRCAPDTAAGRPAAHRAGQLIDTLLAARRAPGRGGPPSTDEPGTDTTRTDAPRADAAGTGRRATDLSDLDQPGDPAAWPPVSVVVPTRDRPELLRAAITAILDQDYPGDLECLVVYDRSDPDGTLADDRPGRRVRVLTNDRTPGLAGGRNTGILAAAGELVAFCDDDDQWLPGKLRAQVAALCADPTAEFCCTGIRVVYDGTEVDRTLPARRVTLNDLLRSRLTELHPSGFLMRRPAVLDGIGLVSEEIPGSYAEDYEFLLRAARRTPIRNVPNVGVLVRWHHSSFFTRRWQTIGEALRWLLDRYPEFRVEPRGHARITGQIAFAEAAHGHRGPALRWAARTLRTSPRELRAPLALAVTCGIPPDTILRHLHNHGRGI